MTHTEKMHHRLREMFTGKRNVFTVTLGFIGLYFFTYPLVNLMTAEFGYAGTMLVGFLILIISSYILDSYHKGKGK